jgi:hypothetical protein
MVVFLSKVFLKDELVRYVVRRALNLPVDDMDLVDIVGTNDYPVMKRVIDTLASRLVVYKNNTMRCGLCGRGPFTKRGLYLHLIRVHRDDILGLIDELIEQR